MRERGITHPVLQKFSTQWRDEGTTCRIATNACDGADPRWKIPTGLSLEVRRAVTGTANHTAGEGSGKFLALNTRRKGRREKVAERPTLRGIQCSGALM